MPELREDPAVYFSKERTIPKQVTRIGKTAFDDCPKLTLRVYAGSYGQTFARERGIAHVLLNA